MAAASSARAGLALRRQQLPEQAVVPVPAAVVAHGLGGLRDGLEQLFQRLALQRRVGVHRLVQIVDIGLVVLVVVEGHRLLVDGRLQRVIGIREGRKRKGHGEAPSTRFQGALI